ncbi:MAG: MmcQ/YjbR family DNA-binding protein [Bacteroidetes bacterium]|nr:MAG: MmcQ/YjbR family DNA-binding protein [Bacteroidota bacterium]
MNVEEIRDYCLAKNGTEESFPFDEETLVIKVMNKMFALVSLEDGSKVNLKCDPAKAIELRERYAEIVPGWHMNKKNWNTVTFNQSIPDDLVKELIDHSYNLVVASLPKIKQQQLKIEK